MALNQSATIYTEDMTDEQKAIAVWRSTVMHRYQDAPPIEFRHEGCAHDPIKTFNVSTCAAFVAAGAGVAIAKHGNRSITSKCGSADVLEALGYRVDLPPCATEELFRQPRHPYTRALLSAVPLPDPTAIRERALLEGDIPSAMNPPPGCRFNTRCRFARDSCRRDEPALADEAGHATACPWWREFPPAPAIAGHTGQNEDRIRLDRLQAAFVATQEAT
mgnify:CR=1 FL=1